MNWGTHILTIFLATAHFQPNSAIANGVISYIIGSLIALLIMGYLVYSLLRPDKF